MTRAYGFTKLRRTLSRMFLEVFDEIRWLVKPEFIGEFLYQIIGCGQSPLYLCNHESVDVLFCSYT